MSAHLVIALQRYTPFGGLERNALALAEAAVARGHRVTVFARSWVGEHPRGSEVVVLPVEAATNVGRDREFAAALGGELRRRAFDAVVGFNRLPGLDVFYAADPCFAATRGRGARGLLPWRKARLEVERALAAPGAAEILVLSEKEARRFGAHYGTPEERLHVLPPGLRDEFLAPGPTAASELRAELRIPPEALLVLAVGSDFARKGLDRTLEALAALPAGLRERAWLLAVGARPPARCALLARSLGLAERVRFAGGRSDVLACYRAADVLVHPAREENTGGVLLEALSQGVPVIAAGACGFAELVRAAQAGVVLAEPFERTELEHALAALLGDEGRRIELGERGRAAARQWPMRARTEHVLAVIERVVERKRGGGATSREPEHRAGGAVPAPPAR